MVIVLVFPVFWKPSWKCGNFESNFEPGDSRNKTRPAKVVVVANSKQKCSVRTHNVVKYTPKNFG